MTTAFIEAMEAACQRVISDEVAKEKVTADHTVLDLDTVGCNSLADKILALPDFYQEILFFRFVFRFSNAEIERQLAISQVGGHLQYAIMLLSKANGMTPYQIVSDQSMERACRKAIRRYTFTAVASSLSVKPHYSKRFRKALHEIPAVRNQNNMLLLIARRVAIFFVVITVSFATTLAVNADVREYFFKWVVETFPQFSLFGSADSTMELTTENHERLIDYSPQFIPEGFSLFHMSSDYPSCIRTYTNSEMKSFSIIGVIPTDNTIAMDTEDAEIRTIMFKNNEAYTWVNKDIVYLVWMQDGYQFTIDSDLDYETTIRIAESIEYVD